MMSAAVAPASLTDAEIDAICAGLRQGAAQVRYLRDVLRVPVQRKPNGRPLVWRRDLERAQNAKPADGPRWSKAARFAIVRAAASVRTWWHAGMPPNVRANRPWPHRSNE